MKKKTSKAPKGKAVTVQGKKRTAASQEPVTSQDMDAPKPLSQDINAGSTPYTDEND